MSGRGAPGMGYASPRVGKREKQRALWPSEAAVSDVVGRLIEFWGFKRNMGRVWTVLYLSPEPLSADDLCHSLKLSTGAVSMTLSPVEPHTTYPASVVRFHCSMLCCTLAA